MSEEAAARFAAVAVSEALAAARQKVATAESCTGGLVAKLLTDIAGSSAWFERGVVSYSNEAKRQLLGVPAEVIDEHGAVSAATVLAMADGLIAGAPVDWTIAISGIAGPGGGTPGRPVGTVWIAWAGRTVTTAASRYVFTGDREAVRAKSARAALEGLQSLIGQSAMLPCDDRLD